MEARPGKISKRPQRLAQMKPNMTSFATVALIINKSQVNIFMDKQNNEHRGVITFTLRDSPQHVVNCKCWGTKETVTYYDELVQLGDVVHIAGAKVMQLSVQNAQATERYQPQPTLPCALVVNEGQGWVQLAENRSEVATLLQLVHLPHKSMRAALSLADVRNGTTAVAQYVDLLVAVALVKPIRELKRKIAEDGTKRMRCLEMVVLDASWPDGMVFTLWNTNWINRALLHWQPRKTIVHLIGVGVSYSDFYRSRVLRHSACTLIYENPTGVESQTLLNYAATIPIQKYETLAQLGLDSLPTTEEIQTPMTIKQIYARAEGELRDPSSDKFTAVLYAMVTKFDLDGYAPSVSKKCKFCQRYIAHNSSNCGNETCLLEPSLNDDGVCCDYFFNINMQLTDQTGTLLESRLSGAAAERLLGYSASAFQCVTLRQKTELKWHYLLKYCEVKLLVKKPSAIRRDTVALIVDLKTMQLDEVMQKVAAF